MNRIARIAESTPNAEKARFTEAVDAVIRANSDESLDGLFERAGLDKGARQAVVAAVYEKFGSAALMDDPDVSRLALRKAVLFLLETIVAKAGPAP